MKPILVVGAGPIGLTTALGLDFYKLPFVLFEEDAVLSDTTKAGTILTRTLEAFRRYGVADKVLSKSLRLDEIGQIERATGNMILSVQTELIRDETRYPFIINMPQHHLEPILRDALQARQPEGICFQHRLLSYRAVADGVVATFQTPQGEVEVEGSYLLACDGGRSTVRTQMGVTVEGESHDVLHLLVDCQLDLDRGAQPRDYPYLSYFSDPDEWMILVRQPHAWRFLIPHESGKTEPADGELRERIGRLLDFGGDIEIQRRVSYRIHHRVASQWRQDRVFLMGDAAHLITPMWALGLNTGVLDAISLPWRLAWVERGWAASALLDGYAREQQPLATHGSGEMAEAAHRFMQTTEDNRPMSGTAWGNALTRTMLGVRLGVEDAADWSMVKIDREGLRVGERIPDVELHGPDGRPVRLHDMIDDSFVALYFTDVRRRPKIPQNGAPGLKHFAVSRWDAPFDSGVRDRSLLDVGDLFLKRAGCATDTMILVRPDDHIAAIMPMRDGAAAEVYERIVGKACL